jgi:hypothetical protein
VNYSAVRDPTVFIALHMKCCTSPSSLRDVVHVIKEGIKFLRKFLRSLLKAARSCKALINAYQNIRLNISEDSVPQDEASVYRRISLF